MPARSKKGNLLISLLLPVLICAGMILAVTYASADAAKSAKEQRYEQLQRILTNAITSCYATEGRYPESVDYLVEHYGLRYNKEEYIISYDVFAGNIRPSVQVIEVGSAGGEIDE